ncbi:MAG: hypothetical protein HY659_09770 [Rhizobiales bacterium]|nr:hypothetical protein [Hyphomicrobiales bacterium]
MSTDNATRHATCLLTAVVLLAAPIVTRADNYPITGKWTYENATADGPAKDCGKRFTDFQGTRRLDKGGSVPDYRNVTAAQSGSGEYRVTDEFFNGQVRGRVNYTLQQRDQDHIELRMSGKTIPLRRCE